ncbi:MAG: hypothetical protein KC550_07515 [Nanoarchaeota archaeon]|nr:hypothetical protein [Nanoarchaeota archaeon]
MFQSLKSLFVKKIENKGLILNYFPLQFNDNISIANKNVFLEKNLKFECLDPSNSQKEVFSHYLSVSKDYDKLMFQGMGISFEIIEILPGLIGREYNKTCSLYAKNDFKEFESLFELVYGEAYFFLEKINDNKIIKIIKVQKGNKIIIPKNYSFTIINTSPDKPLIIYNLHSNEFNYEKKNFEKNSGTILYLTKNKGFVRNKNVSPIYTLEEFNGDYIGEYQFNPELSIYDEFIALPEKFNFLKD